MTPVIAHLQTKFPELPLPVVQETLLWTFDASVKQLGPDFYCKITPLHPVLNMEYSVLCAQLRHNFSSPHINKEQFIEQLVAALMLAELLEHLHLYYLNVPREVARLRRHQKVYRKLLAEWGGYSFVTSKTALEQVDVGISFSQQIRDNTAFANWFRLLLTRSKRVLNFLDLVGTGSVGYRNFVSLMDKYTNPFFAYLALCFFLPRLSNNLFLLAQHTIPGPWMSEEEKSLGLEVRLHAQLQRRWFEVVNDLIWVALGLFTFLLYGPLAPVSVYLTLCAFTIDIGTASFRAFIELKRLYNLQKEYSNLLDNETNEENKQAIREYQKHLTQRIEFEQMRLILLVGSTSSVFVAMILAIPVLAVNPILPLISALLLIAILVVSFYLTRKLEEYRPNDVIEMPSPSSVTKMGFFSQKKGSLTTLPTDREPTSECDSITPAPQ